MIKYQSPNSNSWYSVVEHLCKQIIVTFTRHCTRRHRQIFSSQRVNSSQIFESFCVQFVHNHFWSKILHFDSLIDFSFNGAYFCSIHIAQLLNFYSLLRVVSKTHFNIFFLFLNRHVQPKTSAKPRSRQLILLLETQHCVQTCLQRILKAFKKTRNNNELWNLRQNQLQFLETRKFLNQLFSCMAVTTKWIFFNRQASFPLKCDHVVVTTHELSATIELYFKNVLRFDFLQESQNKNVDRPYVLLRL